MSASAPRSARALAVAAVLAAASVVASGCAPAVDENWNPPTWPTTSLTVVEGEAAPLSAQPGQPLASNVSPERIRQDGVGIQARYLLLPQVPAFNDAVRPTSVPRSLPGKRSPARPTGLRLETSVRAWTTGPALPAPPRPRPPSCWSIQLWPDPSLAAVRLRSCVMSCGRRGPCSVSACAP